MSPSASCYEWVDYGIVPVRFTPGQCSFFEGATAIPQAVGWIIVVAFGALFTLLTSVMVFLDYRFGGAAHTSEQFSTAGRSGAETTLKAAAARSALPVTRNKQLFIGVCLFLLALRPSCPRAPPCDGVTRDSRLLLAA